MLPSSSWRRASLVVLALGWIFGGHSSGAYATTLTVDLSSTLRPVTHVASGSLYGVLEKQPADVTNLIAPLHPNVFNNPASDVQQPIGDAIVVAGRLAAVGGRVTIRLADWFPSWPYAFTSESDFLSKIGQTVSRRKSANLTNIYAYEIWNEPDGTWKSSSLSFDDMWKQTYAQLRQLDPDIKITGPSTSYYNQSFIQSFLSYCKTNGCLPDIIGWHELSGGNVTANVQNYRNLEKTLGIGPLPITINEYSGKADLTVEGQPGASASLIAKFERLGVESACISFWDVGHPGRLGSLLATNTDPNGGWWFYKWYGDMAGNMVSTTPANAADSAALDGFANVDAAGKSASVLFGGVNDGSVQVVLKGFGGTQLFGSRVHVVVEHTPFVNRTTVVKATDMISASDVAISNDQVTVSVPSTNNSDGYRVVLTPLDGVGGSTGSGGAPGAGGKTGTGGIGAGGMTGAGGTRPGTGASTGSAGRSGVAGSGAGGSLGSGGLTATGGAGPAATGGASAIATGGRQGSGGAAPGSGGTSGSGGTGQPATDAGLGTGDAADGGASLTGNDAAGCSCDLAAASSPAGLASASGGLALWLCFAWRRKRGRPRRSPLG